MPIPSFRGVGMGTVGGGAGGASLPGLPPTNYSATWGGIPGTTNPNAAAGQAISGNLSNLGPLLSLGGGVNAWQNAQAQAQLRSGLPLYDQIQSQSSQNILDQISGRAPDDVIDELIRLGAQRGIITGTTNAPNNDAALLRALGLNSLQMTQMGEQNFTNAINRTPRGPLFDPTGMMINPQQMIEASDAANIRRSAPVPSAAGTRALGAAKAGLRAGSGSIGGVQGPTWDSIHNPQGTVRYNTGEAFRQYPTGYPVGGTNLPDAAVDPYQDWMSRTFGSNPTFGSYPGQGNFYAGDDEDRYYADPASGGYIDLDTGDFYG